MIRRFTSFHHLHVCASLVITEKLIKTTSNYMLVYQHNLEERYNVTKIPNNVYATGSDSKWLCYRSQKYIKNASQ